MSANCGPAMERCWGYPVGAKPVTLAFDGANIWVANQDSQTVSKLRASDGMALGTFPVGGVPYGLLFDGANIWVELSRLQKNCGPATNGAGDVSHVRYPPQRSF